MFFMATAQVVSVNTALLEEKTEVQEITITTPPPNTKHVETVSSEAEVVTKEAEDKVVTPAPEPKPVTEETKKER